MANNAAMYDTQALISAGINPAAVLPANRIKGDNGRCGISTKAEIKKGLRIIDE